MMTTDNTPHNPSRIVHGPPPQQPAEQPLRKVRAGRYHHRQFGIAKAGEIIERPHRPPLGRILAEFGMLVIWFSLWVVNGLATIFGFAAIGAIIASRGLAAGLDQQSWMAIGGMFHLFISAVEQHLWRSDYDRPEGITERVRAFFVNTDRMRLCLAVFIGALDSLSTAWYIRRIIYALHTPTAAQSWAGNILSTLRQIDPPMTISPLWGWTVVAGLLAGLIALSAEPMIRNFGGKLITLYREA